jgi:hypothetical protein
MAEDKPNPEPSDDDARTRIDPKEAAKAVRDVQEAMAILPKKRLGCLGRAAKYGAVLLVLLTVFIYWNFLRTPPLRISKETTYITEPLASDGKRVDYFAVLEKGLYPPEMKTDGNGYRLVVRSLGDAGDEPQEAEGGADAGAHSAQVYEKLGLDPAIEPTMSHQEPWDHLLKYGERQGVDERQVSEWYDQVYEPWTADGLPMMEAWLEQNGLALDLLGQAVRKPVFCLPMVRADGRGLFAESPPNDLQRMRAFARSLSARANYRKATGDVAGAIDDVVTCKRLGRHLQHGPTTMAHLVGIAIEGVADAIGIAASAEFQPSEEELRQLVYELRSLRPRPIPDDLLLILRYDTLDWLQAVAARKESLAALFSLWPDMDKFIWPALAECVPVDWNVVMRRVNERYDDVDGARVLVPPRVLAPGNLFLGSRSRRVADAVAETYVSMFQASREADRRSRCTGNLQRIMLAMLIYEREHGTLPPAYTVDAEGKPLHSWRVVLLPYLGEEELYGKLRLDEPWNSEHNRRFHDETVTIYQCPSTELASGRTSYTVVVGESTAFQAGEGKSLDGFGMTLMLVSERKEAVCWMDPASELSEAVAIEASKRQGEGAPGLGSPHPGGFNAAFRNGNTRFISETLPSSGLRDVLDGSADACP